MYIDRRRNHGHGWLSLPRNKKVLKLALGNSLPVSIRESQSLSTFIRHLKTCYF